MTSKIGIWLDRSRAIIVSINDKKCEMLTLSSDIDDARHPRCGTEGHCTIIPESRLRQRRHEIVKKFYQKIVETIRTAGAIFILGPGIAKTELINEIVTVKHLKGHIIGIETADKMSTRQLESKVRKFFDAIVNRSTTRTPGLCIVKH